MNQLASLLNRGVDHEVERRLEELEGKLAVLSSQGLSGNSGGSDGPSEGSTARFLVSDKVLGEKLKKLLTSVLFESGILEKFVDNAVEKRLAVSSGGKPGRSPEAARSDTKKVVKEFLAQNLTGIFQSEIRGAIQSELQGFLSCESMKVLIDDKFRAVQLYLTTEVIPATLKKLLRETADQTA